MIQPTIVKSRTFLSLSTLLVCSSTCILPSAYGQTLTTGIYNSPGQASAYSDPNSPDALFVADGGGKYESFGVEGNVNLTGQELRINSLTGKSPGTFTFSTAKNSSFNWVSGRTYGFTQTYSGDSEKEIIFTLNDAFTGKDYSVKQTLDYGNVALLMIRARTPIGSETNSSSILFSNLEVNGTSLKGDVGLKSGLEYDRVQYSMITGVDFTEAWSFSGDITVAWEGAEPKANKLNFQIKAMQGGLIVPPVPVPEPSVFALAVISLGFCLRRKR